MQILEDLAYVFGGRSPVAGEGHGRFKDPKVAVITRQFLEQHLKAVNNANGL